MGDIKIERILEASRVVACYSSAALHFQTIASVLCTRKVLNSLLRFLFFCCLFVSFSFLAISYSTCSVLMACQSPSPEFSSLRRMASMLSLTAVEILSPRPSSMASSTTSLVADRGANLP